MVNTDGKRLSERDENKKISSEYYWDHIKMHFSAYMQSMKSIVQGEEGQKEIKCICIWVSWYFIALLLRRLTVFMFQMKQHTQKKRESKEISMQ